MFFLFTICSTWSLPMCVSSFVFVIDLKAPFGPQRNAAGFIVQHLKLMLILPSIPWNKAKLLNASWKWLWGTLIIKIAFLGATWYKKCLLELVLLVRAGWGWQWGAELGVLPGAHRAEWGGTMALGCARVAALSCTGVWAWGSTPLLLGTPLSLILQSCTEVNQKYHPDTWWHWFVTALIYYYIQLGKSGNEEKLMVMRGKEE